MQITINKCLIIFVQITQVHALLIYNIIKNTALLIKKEINLFNLTHKIVKINKKYIYDLYMIRNFIHRLKLVIIYILVLTTKIDHLKDTHISVCQLSYYFVQNCYGFK